MREIKVKFWNGKKMSKPYELLDLLYEGVPSLIADTNGGLDTNPKKLAKIVILEWTDLNDKNGKEIYEGDIIQGDANVYGTKKWNKVVKYSDGSFNIDQAEGDLIEVIGNIYESEHLLDNTDMKV